MSESEEIAALLSRLQSPALPGIDLSLERVRLLLAKLGRPERRLPPVIHVAGTNGKGSLLAYLTAIFQAAGYRVHRYTSPHLVRFHERILLRGEDIGDVLLLDCLRRVERETGAAPVTFFEATTAAAFLAFAEVPADVLLLETGLGGRLDATNVVEKPLLTAITPVSLDHCEYLGDTLAAVAREKAGILKHGVPCVVAPQPPEALGVIEERAAALGAPLSRAGKEWRVEEEESGFYYRSSARRIVLNPALPGAHQYMNAAAAIACIDTMQGYRITDAHIMEGISGAVWPARLQRLRGALERLLPADMELWLDGGHNPAAGEMLAAWLQTRKAPLFIVCGMMADKDIAGFLAPLACRTSALYAVPVPGEARAAPPEQLAKIARQVGMGAMVSASVREALQCIAADADRGTALICGSLYLAGMVLAEDSTIL